MHQFNMNIESALVEVFIGEACVQTQQIQAPIMILRAQFENLVRQIIQENQPMKVKMTIPETIYDFDGSKKVLKNFIEFSNLKMCDKEESNNEC